MNTDLSTYLNAVFNGTTGHAHLAVGTGQYINAAGKYKHHDWTETAYTWPGEADKLARAALRESTAGADVYLSPYLTHGQRRAQGAAVARRLVHADIDGDIPVDKVTALGGFAVASGSQGHGHAYVALTEPVPAHVHTALCRALGEHLGAADAKISDNDVLRPPGTLNYKPPTFGRGDPAPVTWLVEPSGAAWRAVDLAAALGVTLPDREAPHGAPAGAVERVDPDRLPRRVREALSLLSGDRSADTMRVVGAAHDAGLTLAQTRGVIALREDLTARLAERRDDDVLTCWLKATDERAQRRAGAEWAAEVTAATNGPQAGTQAAQEADDEAAPRDDLLDERFPVVDWHRLWQQTPEDVEWVCEPLLERGRSTAVYSPPKAGKSLLSLEIAAALACGRPVFGNPAREPLTVLYVDLENTGADIKERLQALGYGPGDLGRLRYLSFPTLAALDSPAGGAQLVALVDRHQATVVIIDTVSRVISGEENDADTFAALYRHAFVPLKARGVTVLRLDHSGKDLEKGQRGSSAKSADVDHVWRLTDHGAGRLALRRDATRTGHGADRLNLQRHYEPLRHEPPDVFTLPGRVADILAELDAAGVPADAGRDRARAALTKAGVKAGNEDLAEALRIRKDRSENLSDLSRTGQPATDRPTAGTTCPDGEDRSDVSAGQTCPGQVADRSGQVPVVPAADLSALSSSLWEDRAAHPDRTDTDDDPIRLCRRCGDPLPPLRAAYTDVCIDCRFEETA